MWKSLKTIKRKAFHEKPISYLQGSTSSPRNYIINISCKTVKDKYCNPIGHSPSFSKYSHNTFLCFSSARRRKENCEFLFYVVEFIFSSPLHAKSSFNLLQWKFTINLQLKSGRDNFGWKRWHTAVVLQVEKVFPSRCTALFIIGASPLPLHQLTEVSTCQLVDGTNWLSLSFLRALLIGVVTIRSLCHIS